MEKKNESTFHSEKYGEVKVELIESRSTKTTFEVVTFWHNGKSYERLFDYGEKIDTCNYGILLSKKLEDIDRELDDFVSSMGDTSE